MKRIRYKIAKILVNLANKINGRDDLSRYPYFRPIDTHIDGIGGKHSSAAYSYEFLKSLIEQDGPDGFGATATIQWLIGEEGWLDVEEMQPKELRRMFAMSGLDIEVPDDNL